MRKITFYLATLSLSISAAYAPSLNAEDQSDFHKVVVDLCTVFDGEPGLPNKGGCISYYEALGPVAFCKELKDYNRLGFFGFTTQGECVASLSRR